MQSPGNLLIHPVLFCNMRAFLCTSVIIILLVILQVRICQPKAVYICDGSKDEAEELTAKLVERGTLHKLENMENWLAFLIL